MSGVIFMSGDTVSGDNVETPCWNPLQCNICAEQYRDPCILQCYHSFCGECVQSKIEAGKVTCPICSCVSTIKEGSSLPSPDPLLKFLVESSSSDKVPCANCDKAECEMFFCNTCSQPLCLSCREETHRARMFARHEIVLLTKKAKDIQKECKLHKEPFILFSTEKKIMLCINCFRDMKVESRSHCVDLETAYKQGCQKLNNTMQSIRDLQHSVRETILLLKALLEEIQQNSEREKQDILTLYTSIEEKISETKATLLQEIEKQYEEKERLFKNQLVHLSTFLPTLHVHLVTCAAFCSSANKYEFLDFTYVLMERLKSIIQVQHPLHPSQGSDIFTDHKTQFAKCLEPLLFPHGNGSNMSVPVSMATGVASQRLDTLPNLPSTAVNLSSSMYKLAGNGGRRYNQNSTKYKLLDTTGFFADHCREFDGVHRELMQGVEGLKLGVQELQRDLTLRRCLAKEAAIGSLDARISEVEESLSKHLIEVEQKQPGLEKHWEESLGKLAGEQEVYKAQIQDVLRLKQETQSVKTILHRLSSFVSSIASVTERLAPKLSVKQKEEAHNQLLQEINTMQHDSQQRVDAIRTAQEERDIKTANRTNPLDEELIKTKGLLKAPVKKDGKDSTKRESREITDAIAELEEERQAKEDKIRKETSGECKKVNTVKLESEFGDHNAKNVTEVGGKGNSDNAAGDIGAHCKEDFKDSVAEDKIGKECINCGKGSNIKGQHIVMDDAEQFSTKDVQHCGHQASQRIDLSYALETQLAHELENEDKTVGVLNCLEKSEPGGELDAGRETENLDGTPKSSNESSKPSEFRQKNSVKSGLSDFDLIQTTAFIVPDVNVELESLNEQIQITNTCEYNAEFTLDYAPADTRVNLSKESITDDVSSFEMTRGKELVKTEIGDLRKHSRERLSQSGSDSNSDNKQEENEANEFDIQEVFGARQLKHVEKPVEQYQSMNGVDSSTSGDDEDVYVAKSLPELAQVFEPGDLKPKRHSRRMDGSRSPNPK